MKKNITIYDNIASNEPEKALALLKSENCPRKPKDPQEIAFRLNELVNLQKKNNEGLFKLLDIHPDKEIFDEYYKNRHTTEVKPAHADGETEKKSACGACPAMTEIKKMNAAKENAANTDTYETRSGGTIKLPAVTWTNKLMGVGAISVAFVIIIAINQAVRVGKHS